MTKTGRPKESEVVRQQLCLRCNHAWYPRTPGRPTVCPQCRSPRWDTPPRRRIKPE